MYLPWIRYLESRFGVRDSRDYLSKDNYNISGLPKLRHDIPYEIMTDNGIVKCRIIGENVKNTEDIKQYILFNYYSSFNVKQIDIVDMLKNYDIGIRVFNNKCYINISRELIDYVKDKNISKSIFNLYAGNIGAELKCFNQVNIIKKLLSYDYAKFDKKAILMGYAQKDILEYLKETMGSVNINGRDYKYEKGAETYGINLIAFDDLSVNIASQVIYNELKYKDTNNIFDCMLKTLKVGMNIDELKYYECHKDKWDKNKLTTTLEHYNKIYNCSVNSIDALVIKLNINRLIFVQRLLSGWKLNDAIEQGVVDRDKYYIDRYLSEIDPVSGRTSAYKFIDEYIKYK